MDSEYEDYPRRDRAFERQPRGEDRIDSNIGSIKLKIPSFEGKDDPDAYLMWERKVESIFLCHNYTEDKKVKLAAVEFTGYAVHWWDQINKDRR